MEQKKQYPKVYTKNKQGAKGPFKIIDIIISDELTQQAIYTNDKGQKVLKILLFPTGNSKYSDDNAVFGTPTAQKETTYQPVGEQLIDPSDLPF